MGAQSWRQADTAAMARNYYENGHNFFYPQIDWGGNSAGFVETDKHLTDSARIQIRAHRLVDG